MKIVSGKIKFDAKEKTITIPVTDEYIEYMNNYSTNKHGIRNFSTYVNNKIIDKTSKVEDVINQVTSIGIKEFLFFSNSYRYHYGSGYVLHVFNQLNPIVNLNVSESMLFKILVDNYGSPISMDEITKIMLVMVKKFPALELKKYKYNSEVIKKIIASIRKKTHSKIIVSKFGLGYQLEEFKGNVL